MPSQIPHNALRRQNVAPRAQLEPPNAAAECLIRDYYTMCAMQDSGALKAMVCSGINDNANPYWVTMPPEGRRFMKLGRVLVDDLTEGVPFEIQAEGGNEIIPFGYAGVCVGLINMYAGSGFVEGSGDIVWSVKINQRWIKDYGNIKMTLGTLQAPCMIYRGGVRLLPHQLLRYYVTLGTGAKTRLDPGAPIITGLMGWVNPQ